MSTLIEENNTLTTDAVPDAPRTNIKQNEEKEREPEANNDCKENTTGTNQTKQQKPSSSIPSYPTKPKKAIPGAKTANTNVINIVNSHSVHVGPVKHINYHSNMTNRKEEPTKPNILRTAEIDVFLSKGELVQRNDMDFVSTHLGLGWRDVGLKLGYSNGQLDHFYADNNQIGIKEVVYQMLLDWTRMYPSNCKIGILSSALWDADQKEVVSRWMKNFNM